EELYNKFKIQEQLHRWSRGADRNDTDVMNSVFHPDANINYKYRTGTVGEFIPWVFEFHLTLVATAHILFNLLIRLDGENAYSEVGVDCRIRYEGESGLTDFSSLARYLDRWERRNGVWKIIDRVSVLDSYGTLPVQQAPEIAHWADLTLGSRSKDDPSYHYIF
ncbi:MAG TPA: nuclear transport factor 2 family protein, partial [Sphingomicrobium sp.]|nr:nuclear transport factor 2 family protein [Sphingomicrobium sp.]